MKNVMILCFVAAILAVAASCSVEANRTDDATCNSKDYERRLELAEYSLTGDYKITEEEAVSSLEAFLMHKGSSFANGRLMSKCDDGSASYKISKLNSACVSFSSSGNVGAGSVSRKSDSDTDTDTVELSIFGVDGGGEHGIALMSDDRRIGDLLFYQENEECFDDDITGDSFMQVYAACLHDYISRTAEIWESIDESDYDAVKKKYGITDEDIEKAKALEESGIAGKRMFGTDYGEWSEPERKVLDMRTEWEQSEPFNYAVKNVYGVRYLTGCGAVAIGQIMAYHKYPERSVLDEEELKVLRGKYDAAHDWDGVYPWDDMTANKHNVAGTAAEVPIACLMYEIGKHANIKYSEGGSGISAGNVSACFNKMGYISDGVSPYSFDAIKRSIDDGRPVFIGGSSQIIFLGVLFWRWEWPIKGGHSWVIDGYFTQERDVTKYIFWVKSHYKDKNDYVHCNVGWGGNKNGWYKSGVFDMSDGANVVGNISRQNIIVGLEGTGDNKNFSKALKIIPNIHISNLRAK